MRGGGLFHIHKRKRAGKTLDPYPSSTFWIRALDQIAIAAGIIGPAMTIPQIWRIFYFQMAAGVSVLSWMSYTIIDIPFIIYGIAHKNKLILFTYILWFIANALVTIGAVMYQ